MLIFRVVVVVVVVSFSEFSGKLLHLTVLLFTADYGKTCSGGAYCVATRTAFL